MANAATTSDAEIATFRAFNRFYTRQLGLLKEGVLESSFSLTEVRVLYELAHRDDVRATDLASDLGLDQGYLSRILTHFEANGLVRRRPSTTDGRQNVLTLTSKGRTAFAPINAASHNQIAGMLAPLAKPDRDKLVHSMLVVQGLLGSTPQPKASIGLRDLKSGDLGWIIHRQAVLYAQEYGWDATFEGLVAEIAAAFVKSFNADKERCWIAERDGEVVGSVFLVCDSNTRAKLRLLYVEPSARGLGIGRQLVDECIQFAREAGYRTLTLWTNDVLVAARRIYQAAGFKLTKEEPHRSFGKDLVGQTWVRKL